ncbi:hypothetical protein C8J57DRAFT_382936 [Mycena rebaudengoi]|nr:hypothetical protein C8J57DRAFT_382936 [Mycena rebaudengoi]
MHPALTPQNFSKLSPSHRRLARSAINGSRDALDEISRTFTDCPNPQLFAPVYFALLDPSRIPRWNKINPCPSSSDSSIPSAILSMQMLSVPGPTGGSLLIPHGACPDVWSRVWKWVQFLDRHRDDLYDVILCTDEECYSIYCRLIRRLLDHQQTSAEIFATPGVRLLITRAWSIFVDEYHPSDSETPVLISDFGLASVCQFFMLDPIPSNAMIFEEQILGAGGRMVDLARLLVAHLTCVVPRPDHAISKTALTFLGGAVTLLQRTGNNGAAWDDALMDKGITKALIFALRALTVSQVEGYLKDMIFNSGFIILGANLIQSTRHEFTKDALRAGLLEAIVLCPSTNGGVEQLLATVLPRSAVYHSVLTQLKGAFIKVQSQAQTPRFRTSEIFPHWKKFADFTEKRLHVLDLYDSGKLFSSRRCDNLQCNDIRRKVEHMRCGGCQKMFYCSRVCQQADWRDGAHKEVCVQLQTLGLSEPETVGTRDRSFLWALAHHDHQAEWGTLLLHRVVDILEDKRDGKPECVRFTLLDYTYGAVKAVTSRAEVPFDSSSASFRAEWEDHISRVLRSGGRMHLVVMLVPLGAASQYRMVSMRSDTSVIQDTIDNIRRMIEVSPETNIVHSPLLPVVVRELNMLQSRADSRIC